MLDSEEHVMEFELPFTPKLDDLFKPHVRLRDYIKKTYHGPLDLDNGLSNFVFLTTAALCDPYTQPEDSETLALSISTLADTLVALSYREWTRTAKDRPPLASVKFSLSLRFMEILQALSYCLNVDDETTLRHLNIDHARWPETLPFWHPRLGGDDWIKLCYHMSCVLVMAMFKLCVPVGGSYDLAHLPYADYFIRLWKAHTNVLALALELDRELEEDAWSSKGDYFDTPEEIKTVLLGSSAVRFVLAYVINMLCCSPLSSPEKLIEHRLASLLDMTKMLLLDFYDPLSRRTSMAGSILVDLSLITPLLLIHRLFCLFSPVSDPLPNNPPLFDEHVYKERRKNRASPMGSCGDTMVDLYTEDQFDDDIKYVFGYFDSDDESEDDKDTVPMALRTNDDIEFDEQGRDWRDCPRGTNTESTPEFQKRVDLYESLDQKDSSDHFFSDWSMLSDALFLVATMEIDPKPLGQVIVDTIAKAVRDEPDSKIYPEVIYKFLVSPFPDEVLDEHTQTRSYLIAFRKVTFFELILITNPQLAMAIADELLMCPGFRRTIIWFLTHSVNLHMSLIDYIYELVLLRRGNSLRKLVFEFSRQGPLELSEVERLMLLHEIFVNSTSWFLQGEFDPEADLPELRAKKLIQYFCLMIKKLLDEKIIIIDDKCADYYEDYTHDLQIFLIPWIGKVPEARELFFHCRNNAFKPKDESAKEEEAQELEDLEQALNKLAGEKDVDALVKSSSVLRSQLPAFARKLRAHIFQMYGKDMPTPEKCTPKEVASNFNLLFKYARVLFQSKLFVEIMSNELESLLLGLKRDKKEEEEDKTQFVESEFNDKFLNGETTFDDKTKTEAKKKKPKKKKKSKKR